MTILRNFLIFLSIVSSIGVSTALCQKPDDSREVSKSPTLFDEFGKISAEEKSARFDALFQAMQENPGSLAYVFIYCGEKCRYGEIEAHMRGIELKIAGRGFSRDRLNVVGSGYRKDQTVEIWLKTADAYPPSPHSTINIKNVLFTKVTGRFVEAYDCCEDNGYLWKTFKP
jgi:hypothetical protein